MSSSTPTAPARAIPGRAAGARSVDRQSRGSEGGEAHTTNNRMELMAVISALEALSGHAVDLHTDSQYLREGIRVDQRLEAERLEHGRQQAGEERRPVAAARRRARATTRCTGTG